MLHSHYYWKAETSATNTGALVLLQGIELKVALLHTINLQSNIASGTHDSTQLSLLIKRKQKW